MGGDRTTQEQLRGGVGDEGGTPEEVAGDVAKGRKSREGLNNNSEGGDKGEKGEYGGSVRYGAYRGRKLGNDCGPSPVGVPGREARGGCHVVGCGSDSQGEEGLPGHRPSGVDVEGSGGDSKSLFRSLHHLP